MVYQGYNGDAPGRSMPSCLSTSKSRKTLNDVGSRNVSYRMSRRGFKQISKEQISRVRGTELWLMRAAWVQVSNRLATPEQRGKPDEKVSGSCGTGADSYDLELSIFSRLHMPTCTIPSSIHCGSLAITTSPLSFFKSSEKP